MRKDIPVKVIIDTLREHGNEARVGEMIDDYTAQYPAAQLAADRLEEMMEMLDFLYACSTGIDGWNIKNVERFLTMRGDS